MKWPDLGPGEWARSGRLLSYLRPVGWILHGVLAERSGTPDNVYVWRLSMPLAVPTDVLDLSWSDRIGSGTQTYSIGSVEANAACIDAAQQARDLFRRGPVLLDPPGGADNVRMQEARAYGLVASGETANANEVLNRVLRYRPVHDWENEILERAETVRRLLDGSDPSSALDQIAAWRTGTLAALGLHE